MTIEHLTSSLQQIMDQAVAANETAGVNLMVLRDGMELLYAQSGYADKENKRPIQKDSIFRLYSMSKPITSAAAMILLERGIIDLCDPVSKFLPGFANQKTYENGVLVSVKRACTIRDLLCMTSGLLYSGADPAGKAAEAVLNDAISKMDGPDALSTIEIANRLGSQPISFHPGDHFMYGTSADILGAVIEIASGMSFGEFLQKELFDPLGMNDTGFWIPADKQSRRVLTYEPAADGTLKEFPTTNLDISYQMDKAPAFESGGAGLASTLPDYARFAAMLIHGGSLDGHTILKERTVQYMTNGQLLPWQQEDMWRSWDGLTGYSYGNLLRVCKDPGMAPAIVTKGEYGWDGWLGPYFSNHPAEGLTILLGMQKRDAGTTSLTRKLRNVILTELL